jgi:hypothetical protein
MAMVILTVCSMKKSMAVTATSRKLPPWIVIMNLVSVHQQKCSVGDIGERRNRLDSLPSLVMMKGQFFDNLEWL